MSTIFENINVLDLTTASADALEHIGRMENINALIFSKSTAASLHAVTQKNINMRAELPEDCVLNIINSRYEMTALNHDKPLFIIANGTVSILADVTVEQLNTKIAGILSNGTIFCPESLKGVLQTKIVKHNGKLVTYMDAAVLVHESVRIDTAYLQTLPTGSSISYMGKVTLTDQVDPALLKEKLPRVEFGDKLLVSEVLLPAISEAMVHSYKAKITTIPADTYYIQGDLLLNSGMLQRINDKRIHAAGIIHIDHLVTSAALKRIVQQLHSDKYILCSHAILADVLDMTTDPAVEVFGYEGKLRVINQEYSLTEAELAYSKDPLSFVINVVMNIAANIDPQVLFDSIGSIVNYGVINCSEQHYGILQSKLLVQEGVLNNRDLLEEQPLPTAASRDDDGHTYISNVNYFKL